MHKTFLFMKRKVSFLFIWKIQKLGHRSVIHILLKFRYEKLFLPHHTFHIILPFEPANLFRRG